MWPLSFTRSAFLGRLSILVVFAATLFAAIPDLWAIYCSACRDFHALNEPRNNYCPQPKCEMGWVLDPDRSTDQPVYVWACLTPTPPPPVPDVHSEDSADNTPSLMDLFQDIPISPSDSDFDYDDAAEYDDYYDYYDYEAESHPAALP